MFPPSELCVTVCVHALVLVSACLCCSDATEREMKSSLTQQQSDFTRMNTARWCLKLLTQQKRARRFVLVLEATLCCEVGGGCWCCRIKSLRAYSQCASTTSSGTVSSGKLTARSVREAVSISSRSPLSRRAAARPMAAQTALPVSHRWKCYLRTKTHQVRFCFARRQINLTLQRPHRGRRVQTEAKPQR